MDLYYRFHDRFGTAGVVIALVALVAALGGTAIAAKGGLTGKQKREVTKIAKKFAGKPGAPGAQGLPGPAGALGKDGVNGTNGVDGEDGTDGKSVTTGTATASECPNGGATVEVEGTPTSKKKICNGDDGDPWTIGGTLPSGETLTGVWEAIGEDHVPLSFPIQLAEPLDSLHVHFLAPNGKEFDFFSGEATVEPTDCGSGIGTGVDVAHPDASAGHLCVYAANMSANAFTFNGFIQDPSKPTAFLSDAGASVAGAHFRLLKLDPEPGSAEPAGYGTWAVTAP